MTLRQIKRNYQLNKCISNMTKKHMFEELGCKCTCMWCTKNEHEMCDFDCNLIPPNAEKTKFNDPGVCIHCGILDWSAKSNPKLKCYENKEHEFPTPPNADRTGYRGLVKKCDNCSRTGTIAVTANNTCPECGRNLDRLTPQPKEVGGWEEELRELVLSVTDHDGEIMESEWPRLASFISNLLAEQRKEIGEKILKSWNTRALLDYADHLITNQEID